MSTPIDSDWFNTALEWMAFILFLLLGVAFLLGGIALIVLVIVGLS